MKREFLQNLKVGDAPLTKEIIDAIMQENGKDINFMVIHKPAVIAFFKHVAPKIIAPELNLSADARKFGYVGKNDNQVGKNESIDFCV